MARLRIHPKRRQRWPRLYPFVLPLVLLPVSLGAQHSSSWTNLPGTPWVGEPGITETMEQIKLRGEQSNSSVIIG